MGGQGSGQLGGVPALEWEEGRRLAAAGAACARGAGRGRATRRTSPPTWSGRRRTSPPTCLLLGACLRQQTAIRRDNWARGGDTNLSNIVKEEELFDTLQTKFVSISEPSVFVGQM